MQKINKIIFLSLAVILIMVACVKAPPVKIQEEPKVKPVPALPLIEKKPIITLPPEPAVIHYPVIKPKLPDSKIWVHFAKTKQGVNYFNQTNILKAADVMTVYVYKIVADDYRKQMIEEVKKYDAKKSLKYYYYEHDVRVDEIDCKNSQWRVKELTHYDDKGNVLDRYTYENEKWRKIKFVTDRHTLQKNICVSVEKPTKKIKK